MPASQNHIGPGTAVAARAVEGGTTFRLWAPHAEHVYVVVNGGPAPAQPDNELVKDAATGHWTGFLPGVGVGSRYRYHIEGPNGSDLKRDPRARELDFNGPPDCDCIVT